MGDRARAGLQSHLGVQHRRRLVVIDVEVAVADRPTGLVAGDPQHPVDIERVAPALRNLGRAGVVEHLVFAEHLWRRLEQADHDALGRLAEHVGNLRKELVKAPPLLVLRDLRDLLLDHLEERLVHLVPVAKHSGVPSCARSVVIHAAKPAPKHLGWPAHPPRIAGSAPSSAGWLLTATRRASPVQGVSKLAPPVHGRRNPYA